MAIDYKIVMSRNLNEEEYKDAIRKCHQRGADRILTLCKSNGGVFIKVGQHIASLQYLLPEAYTDTLSVLHSKAPESNLDDLRKVFSESIGKDVSICFDLLLIIAIFSWTRFLPSLMFNRLEPLRWLRFTKHVCVPPAM
jgi:predicted unusual protein kinase regulating ubiquinone biosynthesis (AarF/ABC1/UbiB family)